MAEVPLDGTDRLIRWTTTLSVIVLAIIAAIVSYKHMYLLVRRYGETSWTAALLPISVDGMIAASSMSLLLDSRYGRRSGLLPWTLLIIGSAASLAANVAVAEPSVIGRLIAGWPSCALIGSYELLMRQIRHANVGESVVETISSAITTPGTPQVDSANSYTAPGPGTVPPYESLTDSAALAHGSEKSHTDDSLGPIDFTDGAQRRVVDGARVQRPLSRKRRGGRRGEVGIQQQAWRWAVANRTAEGSLPSGRAIANKFERSERWGRLVKQAGLAGRLNETAA